MPLICPLSSEKIEQFQKKTKEIIEKTITNSQSINNANEILEKDSEKWYVNGERHIEEKDTFSDQPEVEAIHFDSFFASHLSTKIEGGLGDTLHFKAAKSYLLKEDIFFKAIDKLITDENFVIINIGIDLSYFINTLKIDGLSNDKYKNINIHTFQSSQIVRDSLFILRKSDLPKISTKPIGEQMRYYSLANISNTIYLYASVIDLNLATEEVRNECRQVIPDSQIARSALMYIDVSVEFKWKKDAKVIQLKQYFEYLQKGVLNNMRDIQPFDKSTD